MGTQCQSGFFAFDMRILSFISWTFACVLILVNAKSLPLDTGHNSIQDHVTFLKKYGYLEENYNVGSSSDQNNDVLHSAVKLYQKMSGLPLSGLLDEATVSMMSKPRCGMKDVGDFQKPVKRKKRDLFKMLFGSVWNRWDLTYGVSEPPTVLAKEKAEEIVGRALELWGEASQLRFTKSDSPLIDVKFLRGSHGDEFAFDGKGNVLAHAFYPGFFTGPNGGDIHFDDEEDWTDKTYSGKNLLQVALHESGHSLGLQHFMNPDAIMAPVYKGYNPNVKLHVDDIAAIQELYGSNPSFKPAQTKSTPSPSQSEATTENSTTSAASESSQADNSSSTTDYSSSTADNSTEDYSSSTADNSTADYSSSTALPTTATASLCKDMNIDAMIKTETRDQWTFYAFSGQLLYLLKSGKIGEGFPKPISSVFSWLSGPIDAAVTWPEIRSWTSTCGNPSCYHLQILPPTVLIFKSSLVYKYELSSGKPRYQGVHHLSSLFPGILGKVEAAFYHHSSSFTYLFTDTEIYNISSRSSLTDQGGVIQNGWPRPLQEFNIPRKFTTISAAVQHYDREIYFFFEDKFYGVNETTLLINPDQPETIQPHWMPCESQQPE